MLKKREEEEEARLVALEKNRLEQVARDKEGDRRGTGDECVTGPM